MSATTSRRTDHPSDSPFFFYGCFENGLSFAFTRFTPAHALVVGLILCKGSARFSCMWRNKPNDTTTAWVGRAAVPPPAPPHTAPAGNGVREEKNGAC